MPLPFIVTNENESDPSIAAEVAQHTACGFTAILVSAVAILRLGKDTFGGFLRVLLVAPLPKKRLVRKTVNVKVGKVPQRGHGHTA